jgi:hypothetical protein
MLADTEAKMISKKIIAVACGLFVFSVGQTATFNAAEAQGGFVRKTKVLCTRNWSPSQGPCHGGYVCQKCMSAVRQKGAGNSVRVQCVRWGPAYPC